METVAPIADIGALIPGDLLSTGGSSGLKDMLSVKLPRFNEISEVRDQYVASESDADDPWHCPRSGYLESWWRARLARPEDPQIPRSSDLQGCVLHGMTKILPTSG